MTVAGAGAPAKVGHGDGGPLRVAMIGQRGLPATFGGIEHHVEEIGSRLAARGHHVTVYCRNGYSEGRPAEHRGMRLVHLPTLPSKHLDTICHSALATLAGLAEHFDILHYHALGPGLVAPLPRLLGRSRVVLTVHGLDDQRAKWGRGARRVLRTAQWCSAHVPDATIVVSRDLAAHYAHQHHRLTYYIPNGVARPNRREADGNLRRFGLEPGGYVLFVGRLVPEKAPDLLLRAFRSVPGHQRLVITGGSSHTNRYVADLQRLAEDDPRVVFTGYAYGERLSELYSNAAAFVLPSALEGLPLTLLEAASHGIPVLASDIPPHCEVLGADKPGQRLFPSGDEAALADALQRILSDQATERLGASGSRERVLALYNWDRAAEATESAYRAVLSKRRPEADLRDVVPVPGSAPVASAPVELPA